MDDPVLNEYTLEAEFLNWFAYVRKDHDGDPIIGCDTEDLDNAGTLIITKEEMFNMLDFPTEEENEAFMVLYEALKPDPVKIRWILDNGYVTLQNIFVDLWGMTMEAYLMSVSESDLKILQRGEGRCEMRYVFSLDTQPPYHHGTTNLGYIFKTLNFLEKLT